MFFHLSKEFNRREEYENPDEEIEELIDLICLRKKLDIFVIYIYNLIVKYELNIIKIYYNKQNDSYQWNRNR